MHFLSSDLPGSGGELHSNPNDFIVDEELAYAPSGEGEHLFVQIEKNSMTTTELAQRLAQALKVRPQAIGYAGLKDKHARTRQWFSVHYPIKLGLPTSIDLDSDSCRVLEVDRHQNKLKRSHGQGNRFTITIRDVPNDGIVHARASLKRLGEVGVPNIFGPQRFGRDGDNVEHGLAVIRGETRGPRNRRVRSILESAVQSAVFNRVFEMRLERGLFETALVGDIMKKHESGALFDVADAEAEQVRLDRLEISPTAALPGRKTRESAGIPLEIELAARREVGLDEKDLAKMDVGTRRSLRFPLDPNAEITALDDASYQLSISLPSGAYATVVLAELIKPESGQIIRTKPLET